MPAEIILKKELAASIPTPDVDKASIFLDDSTGEPSYKDDAGVVHTFVGTPGSTGATGPAGPSGVSGEDGTDGADGEPGPAGAVGATGSIGATGAAGPIGPAGLDGTDGLDGDPGPTGATGDAGATGTTGATGAQGPQGPAGADGTDGIDGDQGPTGFTGPTGPTGSTGAVGPAGLGPIFLAGDDGEDGVPGPPGAAGSAGSSTVLYTKWDPLVPDTSPHALSDEFKLSTTISNFTLVNSRGTVDIDTTARHKAYFAVSTQSYRWVCLLKALPGDTNFTIHTKVSEALWGSSAVIAVAGIVLSDTNTTNTGKQTGVGIGSINNDNHIHRVVHKWDLFGETASGASAPDTGIHGGEMYCRFRRQAGTYYGAWSTDGQTWFETAVNLQGAITPAYFGVYIQDYSTVDVAASFEYLRYYAIGTQLNTGAMVNVLG